MPKKLSPAELTRLKQAESAIQTLQRCDFTAPEIASTMGIATRSLFRIIAEERAITHEELIKLQTASIAVLRVQNKVLSGLDLKTVVL